MFGRQFELEKVAELIDGGRIVTIVGPGGVGKSTLAHAFVDDIGRQMLVADLSGLDRNDLRGQVAGVLGFRSWKELIHSLSRRTVALLLDNVEHVVPDVADVVSEGTEKLDGLTVIATSREPLRVPGEQIFVLKPFSLEGRPSEAADYFTHLISMRGLDPPADAEDVERLCALLDGLPLALELAAGFASTLTTEEIARHVQANPGFLSRGPHGGDGRGSSLNESVEWSLELLDSDLRHFLESLSVFDGSFNSALAASVGRLEGDSAAATLIRDLVERSLIVREPSSSGTSWYSLLNTIRLQCRERLARTGRLEEAERLMIAGVVSVSEQLTRPEVLMGEPRVPDQVRRLYRSIKQAVRASVERKGDVQTVEPMLRPLFWLEDLGYQADASELVSIVVDSLDAGSDEEGTLRGLLANLQNASGNTEDARISAAEAIATGRPAGIFFGHRALGLMEKRLGDPPTAMHHLRTGAAAARSIGWEGHALELDGHAALMVAAAGDLEEGLRQIGEVVVRGRDFALCLRCLRLFSAELLIHHDPTAAGIVATEVLEESRKHGHVWATGDASYLLTMTALLAGDVPAAARHLAVAVRSFDTAHQLAELHRALIVASEVLAVSGTAEAQHAAQAGLTDEPMKPTRLDEALFAKAGIEWTASRVPDHRFDVDLVVTALQSIADRSRGSDQPPHAPTENNTFKQQGDVWRIVYKGQLSYVRHSKGMSDLAVLLAAPRKPVAALDLMGALAIESDPGAPLDDRSRRRYQARIGELQGEIEDAERANDPYRAENANKELDAVLQQLSAAFGLTGGRRIRDTSERARNAVRWRIRAAIDRIREQHPELAAHLDLSIRTGRFCEYTPESPAVIWTI